MLSYRNIREISSFCKETINLDENPVFVLESNIQELWTDVKEFIIEVGSIDVSEICSTFDISHDYFESNVLPIAKRDKQVIVESYTILSKEWSENIQEMVLGGLSAAIEPVNLRKFCESVGTDVSSGVKIVKELIEDKFLDGEVKGKEYWPNMFFSLQSTAVERAIGLKGVLNKRALASLHVSDSSSMEGGVSLGECVVSHSFVEHFVQNCDDDLKSQGFCFASEHVSELNESDMDMLITKLAEKSLAHKTTVPMVHLGNDVMVVEGFIERQLQSFEKVLVDIISEYRKTILSKPSGADASSSSKQSKKGKRGKRGSTAASSVDNGPTIKRNTVHSKLENKQEFKSWSSSAIGMVINILMPKLERRLKELETSAADISAPKHSKKSEVVLEGERPIGSVNRKDLKKAEGELVSICQLFWLSHKGVGTVGALVDVDDVAEAFGQSLVQTYGEDLLKSCLTYSHILSGLPRPTFEPPFTSEAAIRVLEKPLGLPLKVMTIALARKDAKILHESLEESLKACGLMISPLNKKEQRSAVFGTRKDRLADLSQTVESGNFEKSFWLGCVAHCEKVIQSHLPAIYNTDEGEPQFTPSTPLMIQLINGIKAMKGASSVCDVLMKEDCSIDEIAAAFHI